MKSKKPIGKEIEDSIDGAELDAAIEAALLSRMYPVKETSDDTIEVRSFDLLLLLPDQSAKSILLCKSMQPLTKDCQINIRRVLKPGGSLQISKEPLGVIRTNYCGINRVPPKPKYKQRTNADKYNIARLKKGSASYKAATLT